LGTTGTGHDDAPLRFADFVVDPSQRSIHRRADTVTLTPKTWAVLYYLASHEGRIVTKDELFATAWPDTVVSDGTLSWCIKEIRRALNDTGRQPRYLKTVYGQGFQFIAARPDVVGDPRTREPTPAGFVGRSAELGRLRQLWETAKHGQRQVGFVTGEAGIGKTTLVDAFLDSLTTESVVMVQGQCVEQYGHGEAYYPVLDALNQLAHDPERDRFVEMLRAHAPSWLPHLTTLLSTEEREAVTARQQETTQTQALRELANALEALAAHKPVVLVLEDLHWSDTATLAFISVLARRSAAARVLVLGTYRPADVAVTDHPLRELKAELQLHRLCAEIAPPQLNETDVHAYAAHRLGADVEQIVAELHARSGGNPLFLVNLVDYLERDAGADTPSDLGARWEGMKGVVPDQVQAFVVVQVEHLATEERRVVEVASVNGATFSPTLVAAALAQKPLEVEAICEHLDRQGRFIRALDDVTRPDGSVETPYEFRHALYREVLYQNITGGQRTRLHHVIGTHLEAAHGDQAKDVAAELALHFEHGREIPKAAKYYALAGDTALRRGAHEELVLQANKGLALVETLPPGATRLAHELPLQTLRAQGYSATKSHTAPEVEHALQRARELSEEAGEVPFLLLILLGLFHVYHGRGAMMPAKECAEASLALATKEDPVFLFGAHYAMGVNALYRGRLGEAQKHFDQVESHYDSEQHQTLLLLYGFNPAVVCALFGAIALGLRGYPDQATRRIEHTLGLDREMEHPFTNVYAHSVAPLGYHCLRREHAMTTEVEAGVTLGTQQGFPIWIAFGTVLRGYGQVAQGALSTGLAEMQRGFASMEDLGAKSQWLHYKTMLAQAVAQTGDHRQALQHLDDALAAVDAGGERFYEPETWRVKGELLLQSSGSQVEECFQRALALARQQEAALFELRAATSLGRLWHQSGKTAEARDLLVPVYGRFSEGFETPDLQDAKVLLAEI